jgi:hypothetical protein
MESQRGDDMPDDKLPEEELLPLVHLKFEVLDPFPFGILTGVGCKEIINIILKRMETFNDQITAELSQYRSKYQHSVCQNRYLRKKNIKVERKAKLIE